MIHRYKLRGSETSKFIYGILISEKTSKISNSRAYSRVFSTFVESAELSAKITLKVFYRVKGLSKFLEVDDTVMMLFIAQ